MSGTQCGPAVSLIRRTVDERRVATNKLIVYFEFAFSREYVNIGNAEYPGYTKTLLIGAKSRILVVGLITREYSREFAVESSCSCGIVNIRRWRRFMLKSGRRKVYGSSSLVVHRERCPRPLLNVRWNSSR